MILNTIAKERTFKPFEIIASLCADHSTVNIRDLPDYAPCWFYFSDFKAIDILTQFLLCINSEEVKELDRESILNLFERLRYIRILHKYTPLEVINSEEKESFRVLLRVKTKIVDYTRGRVCNCLPIPGSNPGLGHLETHKNEPEAVKSPEVIVSSPVIIKALEDLSQIWQDTFARTVLISAPPGSGKEEFAKSIPYGNGRPTGNLQTVSMADCDAIALQRRLYGDERSDGVYVPGLIEIAKGSALFLDEVHQPGNDSPARASLLRTLEAGEYFATNGNKLHRVDNVLFVMATSKRLKELKKYNPPDFWTRMTHAIEMQHPLDLKSHTKGADKIIDIVSYFFNHFWWMRIEGFYGMKPVFTRPPEEMLLSPSKLVVFWQVHSMTQIMGFKCKASDDPNLVPIDKKAEQDKYYPLVFANIFYECLQRPPKKKVQDFSIRGIRSMVTRLFSIAAAAVAQGQSPWVENRSFEKETKNIFKEIYTIACLNQTGNKLRKSKKPKT